MTEKSYEFLMLLFFIFPLITIVLLNFLKKSDLLIKILSFISMSIQFSMLCFFAKYQNLNGWNVFGPIVKIPWLSIWGVNLTLGLDGLTFPYLFISSILAPIIYFFLIPLERKPSVFIRSILFFLILFGMYGSYLSLDLVMFYIHWEIVIVPIFILVGLGHGTYRSSALMKFLLFSIGSSLMMLLAIIILGINFESQMKGFSFNFFDLKSALVPLQPDQVFLSSQWWSCLAFLLALLVKAHAFPLHSWLPDLYKEGTPLSTVVVSALLFNMATYAFFRYLPAFFPQAIYWWSNVLMLLGALGVIYGALCVFVQSDLRQIIAFISVSHVGFFLLGFGSLGLMGFQAAYIQTINHAILATSFSIMLFLICYSRNDYHLGSLSGLIKTLPILGIFFFISILGNIGLPGTNGFIGEFLVLMASFQKSPWITILATFGVVLSATYGLKIYQKIFFNGSSNVEHDQLTDLNYGQFIPMFLLIVLIIFLGIKPMSIVQPAMTSLRKILDVFILP